MGFFSGGRRHVVGLLGALALLIAAPPARAQQASLILSGGDVALCHHNDTDWSLTKTSNVGSSVASGDTVTWTVTATRGATSNNILELNGFVRVTNGGALGATIGNIVVNLQRRVGNNWVSVAANVADATNGNRSADRAADLHDLPVLRRREPARRELRRRGQR